MSKSKHSKQKKPRNWLIAPAEIERWLADASRALEREDYEQVIAKCTRILSAVPRGAKQRAEALDYLSNAYGMLKRFEESYQALVEALEITPDSSALWFNRGMSARFTSRLAESVRDFERAVALGAPPGLAERFAEDLATARKFAEADRTIRGPDFTLDQLTEQQDLFARGIAALQAARWPEAEDAFRHVIAMADVLPQPWGNLGLALLMQRRFDEAEAAFRRALEIDPEYALAREHLESLPKFQESGKLPAIEINQPFAGAHLGRIVVRRKE